MDLTNTEKRLSKCSLLFLKKKKIHGKCYAKSWFDFFFWTSRGKTKKFGRSFIFFRDLLLSLFALFLFGSSSTAQLRYLKLILVFNLKKKTKFPLWTPQRGRTKFFRKQICQPGWDWGGGNLWRKPKLVSL